MKIYDIITEESQQLNEVGVVLSTALRYAMPKGIAAIERVLSWFAGRLAGKPKAAEELAEAWVYLAEKSGMSIDDAISLGARTAEGKVGDDIIRTASQRARELFEANKGKLWSQLKNPQSTLNFYYGALWDTVNTGLMFWGIAEPIYDCVQKIAKVYAAREQGHKELQDLDKVDWMVQYYIDECVRKVVSIWAGNKIVGKVVGGLVPGVLNRIPFVAKLEPIYGKLEAPAKAAFKAWMISDAGQEALAKWIVGQAVMPGTEWKIPGGKLYQKLLDLVSGVAKTGYDHIARFMGSTNVPDVPKQKVPDVDPNFGKNTRYDMKTGRNIKDPSY